MKSVVVEPFFKRLILMAVRFFIHEKTLNRCNIMCVCIPFLDAKKQIACRHIQNVSSFTVVAKATMVEAGVLKVTESTAVNVVSVFPVSVFVGKFVVAVSQNSTGVRIIILSHRTLHQRMTGAPISVNIHHLLSITYLTNQKLLLQQLGILRSLRHPLTSPTNPVSQMKTYLLQCLSRRDVLPSISI